jgi:SAM-dependent methyltransferase
VTWRTVGVAADPLSFGPFAADYDRLRPADSNWVRLLEEIRAQADVAGRRILDVGCGTGRVSIALAEKAAEVVGVDPSEEMLAEARARARGSVAFERGRAEALPFPDGRFERVVARLVVHLVDRVRALPEIRRVLGPGGRLVVATFRPEHFDRIWLAPFFPSLGTIDRARFVAPDALGDELLLAGFDAVRRVELTQRARIHREEALERLRGCYISTLRLLDEAEYGAGLERAARELADVTAYSLEWSLVVATRA